MRIGIITCDESGSKNLFLCELKKFQFKTTMISQDVVWHGTTFDYIVFLGFLDKTIRRVVMSDPGLKQRDLPSFIEFGFIQDLPLAPDDVWWQYRILHSSAKSDFFQICTIAINKTEIARILEGLSENNLRVDNVLSAKLFLTNDLFPELSTGNEIDFDAVKQYMLQHEQAAFREFLNEIDSSGKLSGKNAVAIYAFLKFLKTSGHFSDIYSCPGLVPSEIQPVRCQTLRRIYLFFAAVVAVLCGIVLWGRFDRSYVEYQKIEKTNEELSRQLSSLQKQNMLANKQKKILKQYADLKVGSSEMIKMILELTQKIPSYMWVKSFNMPNSSGVVTLKLVSAKDDSNFYRSMIDGKTYILKNLSKSRGREQSVEYTLTLELK